MDAGMSRSVAGGAGLRAGAAGAEVPHAAPQERRQVALQDRECADREGAGLQW